MSWWSWTSRGAKVIVAVPYAACRAVVTGEPELLSRGCADGDLGVWGPVAEGDGLGRAHGGGVVLCQACRGDFGGEGVAAGIADPVGGGLRDIVACGQQPRPDARVVVVPGRIAGVVVADRPVQAVSREHQIGVEPGRLGRIGVQVDGDPSRRVQSEGVPARVAGARARRAQARRAPGVLGDRAGVGVLAGLIWAQRLAARRPDVPALCGASRRGVGGCSVGGELRCRGAAVAAVVGASHDHVLAGARRDLQRDDARGACGGSDPRGAPGGISDAPRVGGGDAEHVCDLH